MTEREQGEQESGADTKPDAALDRTALQAGPTPGSDTTEAGRAAEQEAASKHTTEGTAADAEGLNRSALQAGPTPGADTETAKHEAATDEGKDRRGKGAGNRGDVGETGDEGDIGPA